MQRDNKTLRFPSLLRVFFEKHGYSFLGTFMHVTFLLYSPTSLPITYFRAGHAVALVLFNEELNISILCEFRNFCSGFTNTQLSARVLRTHSVANLALILGNYTYSTLTNGSQLSMNWHCSQQTGRIGTGIEQNRRISCSHVGCVRDRVVIL